MVHGSGAVDQTQVEIIDKHDVRRGDDAATLKGMEIITEFGGVTHKTSLRAPESKQTKRYVFSYGDKLQNPGKVSVAPIYLDKGRTIVGIILSSVRFPYSSTGKTLKEVEDELQETDNFVIELDPENPVKDLLNCPAGKIPDPWGGCAIYKGDIFSVSLLSDQTHFDFGGNAPDNFENDWDKAGMPNYLQFGGSGTCNDNREESCSSIIRAELGGIAQDKTGTLTSGANLLTEETCTGRNNFYIYDNPTCK